MDSSDIDLNLPPQLSSVLTGGGWHLPTSHTGGDGRYPVRCNAPSSKFDKFGCDSNPLEISRLDPLGDTVTTSRTVCVGNKPGNVIMDFDTGNSLNRDQERRLQQSSQDPDVRTVATGPNSLTTNENSTTNSPSINQHPKQDQTSRNKNKRKQFTPVTMENLFAPLNWARYITIKYPENTILSGLRIDKFLRNYMKISTPYFKIEKDQIVVKSPSEELSKKLMELKLMVCGGAVRILPPWVTCES